MNILHSFLLSFLKILWGIIHKKIIYVTAESLQSIKNMATIDPIWFWYVGNLYTPSDIAYGIANTSIILNEWRFVKDILESLLSKDTSRKMYFYDIGANTWYFGILAGYISWGRLMTHFFEPLSIHTDCIRQSVYLNRLEESATIHELWISNENAEKTFHIAWSGSSLLSDFSWTEVTDTCSIVVRKLGDYQNEKNLWLPDFVKIDVEWNEYEVIQGGMKLFEQSLPVLYVEIAKDLKNIWRNFENPNFSQIFTLLESIGYVSYRVDDDYNRITPYLRDRDESWVHMYLFFHENNHKELIEQYAN